MARKRPNLTVVESKPDTGPLDDYDENYLECRGVCHPWQGVGYFRDGAWISRLLRCPRCGMEKITTMRRDGALMGPAKYSRPDGYSIANGGGSTQEVRQEALRRAEAEMFGSYADLLAPRVETIEAKRSRRRSS